MASAAASNQAKGSYRVTNWRDYNESLVRRGDVTFWFDEDVLVTWEHDNAATKVGRPFTYSDRAIECLLALRELFRLPYRQTEGLGRSLAKLLGPTSRSPTSRRWPSGLRSCWCHSTCHRPTARSTWSSTAPA